jgi:hypothetical protein
MKKVLATIVLIITFSNVYSVDTFINAMINFSYEDTIVAIDSSQSNNLWQIGVPTMELFDSAYSTPNAIYTHIDSTQNGKNFSSFTIIIVSEMLASGFLEFKHKYEMDPDSTCGYIDFSYDQGTTWHGLEWAFNYWFEGFYSLTDTICRNQPGFTGKSDGWQTSMVIFEWYPGVKKIYPWPEGWGWQMNGDQDTLLVRFNYVNDRLHSTSPGWVIDDIFIQIYEYAGSTNNMKYDSFQISYIPVQNILSINSKNLSNKPQNVIISDLSGRLRMTINHSFDRIDVSSLEQGLYIVSIFSNNVKCESAKILIHGY